MKIKDSPIIMLVTMIGIAVIFFFASRVIGTKYIHQSSTYLSSPLPKLIVQTPSTTVDVLLVSNDMTRERGLGGENVAIKMYVPDKFKHVMVIPRRRLLRKYYWTPGRIALRAVGINGTHGIEKEVCRRFRSGSKSLTKVLARSGVKYENHLVIGAHGDDDNPYAVNEKELYKRMWSDPRTEAALDQLKEMQPDGDFVAFPFYIPREPLKVSAQSVIDGLARGEFGITSWMLEYAVCAQIGDSDLRKDGPFAPDVNDLEISAPGDVYAQPGTMGKRDCVTIFSWQKSTLQVDLLPVNGIRLQRPAIGFIPTEVRS